MASNQVPVEPQPSPAPTDEFEHVPNSPRPQTAAGGDPAYVPPSRRPGYADTRPETRPTGILGPERFADQPESAATPRAVEESGVTDSPTTIRAPTVGPEPASITPEGPQARRYAASLSSHSSNPFVARQPGTGVSSTQQPDVQAQQEDPDSSDDEDDVAADSLQIQVNLTFGNNPFITKESTKERIVQYTQRHFVLMERMGQSVPPRESDEYIMLFIRLLNQEISQYSKRRALRESRGESGASTPLEAVHNYVPTTPGVAEAIRHLHRPQQPSEATADYAVRQAASQRQRNTSGVAHPDLSAIETMTTGLQPAGPTQDELRGTAASQVKFERHDTVIPESAPSAARPGSRIPMAEKLNERVNLQRIRNEELRTAKSTLIDDQAIEFAGDHGVTPRDVLRQRYLEAIAPRPAEVPRETERMSQVWRTPEPTRGPRSQDRDDPLHLDRPQPRAYSMPPAIQMNDRSPGISEAHRNYRMLMHDRLEAIVDDALGVAIRLPEGVKMRKSDGRHVGQYTGSASFTDMELWVMELCDHLAACMYGGPKLDFERILAMSEFLGGEAKRWFQRHVRHINRSRQYWTFKDVIVGLYDRFVNATTMQDAQEAFSAAKYSDKLGVQGFYDTLIDHSQNMAVLPTSSVILVAFLDGLPVAMRRHLLEQDRLTPELNTVDDFLAYAIAYESALKTSHYYERRANQLHQ